MLRISNLTLSRGARRLLEGASLTVHAGHKVGLVGANGSGKSSLFAAIRHELLPDVGSIDLPAAWTIAAISPPPLSLQPPRPRAAARWKRSCSRHCARC